MNCSLMGSLPKSPLNLTHLTYLDLSFNKLNGTLPSWLFTLPSLESVNLQNNMFSGDVSFNSFALPPLRELFLSQNQLGGMIDQALIMQLTNLTRLDLASNNFSSDWELDTLLSSLTNLVSLDLSYSGLTIRTSNATHYVNPNLWFLFLASCKIKEFPGSLLSMRNLEALDLSSNEIHGDVSIWAGEIGGDSQLRYLDLSHNFITGLPQFQLYGLNELRLESNQLLGPFPPSIYNMRDLHTLYLKSNLIEGPFPPSICSMSNLQRLDISDNRFGGVIPHCVENFTFSWLDLGNNHFQGTIPNVFKRCLWLKVLNLNGNQLQGEVPSSLSKCINLKVMDLGNNHFQGTIPNVFENFLRLEGLILNGNQLQGEVPSSLSKCKSLKVLDLGNNHLNGTFPHWLGGLTGLQALILKSNKFHGPFVTFPIVESPFPSLRVLDLSHNGFVGQLPQKYFENLKAMKDVVRSSTRPEYLNINGFYYSVVITVKGLELPFAKISVDYTIVDLSNNRFEGEIPKVIGNLTSLIVLNLSHNNVTGHIPHVLGNLLEIESLDLSWNQLTGEIPQSLAELTFLGFLNLSQNHLVGRIPTGKQFNTFEGNSFGGNLNLCGLPLPKKCNEKPREPHLDGDGDEEEIGFTWKVVMLGYGCGTLFGFVIGYLMLSFGRPKWFNAIADAMERMILTMKNKKRYIYIGR